MNKLIEETTDKIMRVLNSDLFAGIRLGSDPRREIRDLVEQAINQAYSQGCDNGAAFGP